MEFSEGIFSDSLDCRLLKFYPFVCHCFDRNGFHSVVQTRSVSGVPTFQKRCSALELDELTKYLSFMEETLT